MSRAANAALSERNDQFLHFVEENAECLDRSRFEALDRHHDLIQYPLQPWPTFVRRKLVEELGDCAVAVFELVKSIPRRLFANDPRRLDSFYGLGAELAPWIVELLEDSEHVGGLISRGDFILTPSGPKCLEVNATGNLGGWQAEVWGRQYRGVPLLERFLRERSVQFHSRDIARTFFSHVASRASKRGWVKDELNVAFVIPEVERRGPPAERYARDKLAEAVRDTLGPMASDVIFCGFEDLTLDRFGLQVAGRRIQALAESHHGVVTAPVFRGLLAGAVDVYNGPLTALLSDKRNLALLSNAESSPRFSAEERDRIRALIPWTRELGPGATDFAGQPVDLLGFVARERERLVLKPAASGQGEGVAIGRQLSNASWDEAVAGALGEERRWIVQEHVETLPMLYLDGDLGASLHDVVWGLFVFGGGYGGGFLRMMAQSKNGVINAARGASEGVLFEVED